MNDLQLTDATPTQEAPPWWYVRPPLSASLATLLLICMLVWLILAPSALTGLGLTLLSTTR